MQTSNLILFRKFPRQPLGELLREAHLVTDYQIKEALQEQAQEPDRRIGEILADKGCLKQETVEFFAQEWQDVLLQIKAIQPKQPLGYYLQEAALLDEGQIQEVLSEQGKGKLWMRLGALVVIKGWLQQSTIDFFLENLFPEYFKDSPFIKASETKTLRNRKHYRWHQM